MTKHRLSAVSTSVNKIEFKDITMQQKLLYSLLILICLVRCVNGAPFLVMILDTQLLQSAHLLKCMQPIAYRPSACECATKCLATEGLVKPSA